MRSRIDEYSDVEEVPDVARLHTKAWQGISLRWHFLAPTAIHLRWMCTGRQYDPDPGHTNSPHLLAGGDAGRTAHRTASSSAYSFRS